MQVKGAKSTRAEVVVEEGGKEKGREGTGEEEEEGTVR